MAVPVLPEEFTSILTLLASSEAPLTWNVNRSSKEVTLRVSLKLAANKHVSHTGLLSAVKATSALSPALEDIDVHV